MEFTPRFPQPFSLDHAISLDVSVITDEISRLRNSLLHLRRTQDELNEFATSDDADIVQAIEENRVTIGSQEERIFMLELALIHKGASSRSGHYELATTPTAPSNQPIVNGDTHPTDLTPQQPPIFSQPSSAVSEQREMTDPEENGVFL